MIASLSKPPAVGDRACARPGTGRHAAGSAVRSASAVGLAAALLLLLIRAYQWLISPLLGPCCRFEPSCSRYMATCIERQGVVRGVWLGARRLVRCNPFCAGGHDPPPETTS